jgi:hypothetical protein
LEVVKQLLVQITLAVGRQANRLRDGRNDQIAPGEWLQPHEHRAVRKLGCDRARRLDRQAGLAAAAQTRQRQQPAIGVTQPHGDVA